MSNLTLTHLEYCTYCPKMCRHACPVSTATGRETVTPQAKMSALNLARKGHAPMTRETLEPIYACTGCRHCTEYCLHGVEPAAVLFAGRAEAERRGVGHPALERYPERFRARDERLGKKLRALIPSGRFAPDAQVALWPGCDAVDKGEADVLAQLAVLDRIGERGVRVAATTGVCAGYPLLAAGHPDVFRWHATRVASELRPYRTVAMSCAACVYAIRTLYPAEGVAVATEVKHISELLGGHADKVLPTAPPKVVYYHDPCYLARYLDVTEPPRKLLGRVAEVRELAWTRKDTECCGGGGLLPKTMPAVADEMARRRLRDVADGGGGTVVTSCATCKHMLARNAPPGVVVRDLVEFVDAETRVTSPGPAAG
jgi:Fe-S oxidoreductase